MAHTASSMWLGRPAWCCSTSHSLRGLALEERTWRRTAPAYPLSWHALYLPWMLHVHTHGCEALVMRCSEERRARHEELVGMCSWCTRTPNMSTLKLTGGALQPEGPHLWINHLLQPAVQGVRPPEGADWRCPRPVQRKASQTEHPPCKPPAYS